MFPSLELIISMVRETYTVKVIALPSWTSSIGGAGYEKKTQQFFAYLLFYSHSWVEKNLKCMVFMPIKLSTVYKL